LADSYRQGDAIVVTFPTIGGLENHAAIPETLRAVVPSNVAGRGNNYPDTGGLVCRWLDSVAEEFLSVDFKATLHTFNRKHYEPIPGISLIQPYKKG